jgi:LysM repeat protein
MRFNDSNDDDSLDENKDDNYFDGIEHSSFFKKRSGFKLSSIKGMPVLLYLTVGVVLIALVGLFAVKSDPSFDPEDLSAMNDRLKQMEDRFIDQGELEKKIAGLEGQGERIDRLEKQFNTLESNLAVRMQKINSPVQAPKQQIVKSEQKSESVTQTKAVAEKKPVSSENSSNYHLVQPGDTLYSIIRKYNLSDDELKQLNPSLPESKTIYLGQKLRIKKR